MKRILSLSAALMLAIPVLSAERLLILAPSDLYEDWKWYAEQRKGNHPEVDFDVVNTADIYKDYPYLDERCPKDGPRKGIAAEANRYPSESIYKWLLSYRNRYSNLKYLVLGGAWLDVTDPNVQYHQDGTEINLGNAIPSMRVKPNIKGDGFYNPSDMYYACLSKKDGETGHHWDPNDDGIYLEGNHDLLSGEESKTKGWADIAVSRMTMKPIVMDASVEFNPEFELVGGQRVLNQHQLITNFLYKVNRAEGKGVIGRRIENNQLEWDRAEDSTSKFAGNHKLAITSSYLVEPQCYLNNIRVLRDEQEFFDGVPNMYAPEHPQAYRDTGPHMRRHVSEVAALNRPVLDTVSCHQGEIYGKGTSASNFSQVFNTTDREIGAVNGHGWAGGTGWFSAKTFSTCPGLTKINVVGISCETGYLDIYGNQNGKSVANLSLGESGMANVTKTGGVIASINNSRYGWVNWETEQLFGLNQSWRLHYWFYDGVVKGMNAGSAWLRMANNYYNDFKYDQMPPAIPGQCYTQMMLFGDPLIAVVNEPNPNAVMEYSVPVGTTSLDREGYLLKVMRGMSIAGNKLEIGINGGVGGVGTYQTSGDVNNPPNEQANAKRPNGLKFTGEAGELVFNNTKDDAYFFVNKIENAKKITFAGAGAIINTDEFDSTLPNDGLVFEGQANFVGKTAKPNVIRANLKKTTGNLCRFLPLNLSNTSLQFETYDAFNGYTGTEFATLTDSKLCFRVSRWRGLGDYPETVRGNLTLNSSILAADYPAVINLASPTITVSGDSAIETTNGGTFQIDGKKTINLAAGSNLILDAEFVNKSENAALDINGSGRIILKSLPLKGVSALTIGEGVSIELPMGSDFYQILPSSASLIVSGNTDVYIGSEKVDVVITPTGAIFKRGSIMAWEQTEGTWNGEERYFPDLGIDKATVNVVADIPSAFTAFANNRTTYTFLSATSEGTPYPTITFDALSVGGTVRFAPKTVFNTRLYIAGGDFYGREVISPSIEIAEGGKFGATVISTPSASQATEVIVRKGSTLLLNGEHSAIYQFEAGAKLEAGYVKTLRCTDKTTFVWPGTGKVIVDVGDFEVTNEPTPIILGAHADMAFLRHLETNDDNVSLAINDAGDVCLVAIENVADNWVKDDVITIDSTDETIKISSPKRSATLTYKTTIENAVLTLEVVEGGLLLTDELRFEGFSRVNLVNVKLGTGTLYAAPETHISGDSSGRLSVGGNDTVYLESPTDSWTLAEGIQGIIHVGITERARGERQQVFTIAEESDWPIGGLSVVIYDPETGETNGDFSFVREGTAVYLAPPGIKGVVSSAGATKWSELQWLAYDGKPVEITDWANVYSVEIVSENDAAVVVMDGAPKLKLVTSGSKLTLKGAGVTLPSEIVFNNELTIQGAILPALDYVKGDGKLILDTGDVTAIVIPGSIMPISAPVEIKKNSTLRLAHQTYFQNKAADFTSITGEGTLEIKDVSPNGARFFMPEQRLMFPSTLTFKLETELELQRLHCDNPLTVGNLCGSGKWGYGLMDPNTMLVEMGYFMNNNTDRGFDKWKAANCGTRVMKTIQSDISEWSGWMPDWYGVNGFGINFNVRLVVTGDGSTPNLARRFVFSGQAADNASLTCTGDKGANHDVTIDSSGAFELNGYWNGNIVNNGILVLGDNRTIKAKTSFSGSGKLAILGTTLDLTEAQHAQFKDKYPLLAGSYGTIVFAASSLESEQVVMKADAFTPTRGEELTLVAVLADGSRHIQQVSEANLKDGKLVYLAGDEDYLDVDSLKGSVSISGTRTIHLFSSSGMGVVKLASLADSAKIIIEAGVELVVEMSSTNRNPFVGHEVYITKGGRLVLLQMDNMYQSGKSLAGVNLSNLKGTGTLEFRAKESNLVLKLPSSRRYTAGTIAKYYWDENLSICINTNVYCDYSYEKEDLPLVLRNLSGNGKFGLVGNAGEQRYIEIELKGVAKEGDFTGTFANGINVKYTTLRSPIPKILFR